MGSDGLPQHCLAAGTGAERQSDAASVREARAGKGGWPAEGTKRAPIHKPMAIAGLYWFTPPSSLPVTGSTITAFGRPK